MEKSMIFALLLSLGSQTSLAKEKSRPMDEMHGDCAAYQMNLQNEMALWQSPAAVIASGANLPIGAKAALSLAPANSVQFLRPPQKTFPIEGQKYSGLFKISATKNGQLRVAAGSRLWFDLYDEKTKSFVDATEFEMQTKCDKIFKVVSFNVKKGSQLILQVSSSPQKEAQFLISQD